MSTWNNDLRFWILAVFAMTLVLETRSEQPTPCPAPLAYDLSAYELAPEYKVAKSEPWTKAEAKSELLNRVAFEKQRREMDVYYYRIGYTLSFPLRLETRPKLETLPTSIPGLKYPYLIWLSWNMEERWRLLHFAWRKYKDEEAGRLLQEELAALEGWDRFAELNDEVGLVTGHFAAVLSMALSNPSGWDPVKLQKARKAASNLIDRDIDPWFEKKWASKEVGEKDLVNIPVIALVRAAQLARVLGNEHRDKLEKKSEEVLRAWARVRVQEQYTEGTAYDGYLMDSVTEWLEETSHSSELKRNVSEAFGTLADAWAHSTLPGRLDIHAPIGDVEPEMAFWANALWRINAWYPSNDSTWLLHNFPLHRMRAAALIMAVESPAKSKYRRPKRTIIELPNMVVMRTGWDVKDIAVFAGLSRSTVGHLHADGGSAILGWNGRFWITDPGYQQYRPGDERNYTLGPDAHNTPVIEGISQTIRKPELKLFDAKTRQAMFDLTKCYRGLPAGASVIRTISLVASSPTVVVIEDTFNGLKQRTEVRTSWHGGHHLAWSFPTNRAKLSDGIRALWIGLEQSALSAHELWRHSGTRGPLTMTHTNSLAEGSGTNRWTFRFEGETPRTEP